MALKRTHTIQELSPVWQDRQLYLPDGSIPDVTMED